MGIHTADMNLIIKGKHKKTLIFPVLISFAISAALGPVVIPLLRKMKFGQTEREEGPKSHLKKTGTPTMGGIMFIIGTGSLLPDTPPKKR